MIETLNLISKLSFLNYLAIFSIGMFSYFLFNLIPNCPGKAKIIGGVMGLFIGFFATLALVV